MAKTKTTPEKIEERETLDTGPDNGTRAGDTIKAQPNDVGSKMAIMMQALSWMGKMKSNDLSDWFTKSIAQIGHEADSIGGGTAEKNKATVAMKEAIENDIKELFAVDETLTEEFKTKATVIFEAAVGARVALETARLEEEYESKLDTEVEEISKNITEKFDEYATYAATEWMKENEVAIDKSLRNELIEEFISGMRTLMTEMAFDIPEDKIDVVEELSGKVEEIETRLNKEIEEKIALTKELATFKKQKVVEEVALGLTATQIEKFKKLSEGVDFDGTEDEFKTKLNVVKTQYFSDKKPGTLINEAVEEDEEPEKTVINDPRMRRYAEAISRTVQK